MDDAESVLLNCLFIEKEILIIINVVNVECYSTSSNVFYLKEMEYSRFQTPLAFFLTLINNWMLALGFIVNFLLLYCNVIGFLLYTLPASLGCSPF